MPLYQIPIGLLPEEGHVAVQDQHIALITGEGLPGTAHRMARAQLLLLLHIGESGHLGHNGLFLVAHDQIDVLLGDPGQFLSDIPDEGFSPKGVKDLG